jgi:hypothetical protein
MARRGDPLMVHCLDSFTNFQSSLLKSGPRENRTLVQVVLDDIFYKLRSPANFTGEAPQKIKVNARLGNL